MPHQEPNHPHHNDTAFRQERHELKGCIKSSRRQRVPIGQT
jgi:hypothetical protein